MAHPFRITTRATLAKVGTQLTKAHADFETHLARVAAEAALKPIEPIITTTKPLADGVAALHNQLQSLNSRKQALRARGSYVNQDESLRDLLAQEFRNSGVIGTETGAWRLRRALSEVAAAIEESTDWIGEHERLMAQLLQALLKQHAAIVRVEEHVTYAAAVASVDRLEMFNGVLEAMRDADALPADMAEMKAEIADLEQKIRPGFRTLVAEQHRGILELLRSASRIGVRVARQAQITEYLSWQ